MDTEEALAGFDAELGFRNACAWLSAEFAMYIIDIV